MGQVSTFFVLYSHPMKALLTIFFLVIGLLLVSCDSSNQEETSDQLASEGNDPMNTLEDHQLFTASFVVENELITKEMIQDKFNVSGESNTWNDSVQLENCSLYRSFHFDNNELTGIKLVSFSDSTQLADMISNLDQTINNINNLLGSPKSSSLYATSWSKNDRSYKLKVYPSEGLDFVISKDENSQQTQCVGEFFDAKTAFESIVSQLLQDQLPIDTTINQIVPGIVVNYSGKELQLTYECEVSKKLVIIDNSLIINSLNSIAGMKSIIKDDIHFWETDRYELQLSKLQNGHLLKFIPQTD